MREEILIKPFNWELVYNTEADWITINQNPRYKIYKSDDEWVLFCCNDGFKFSVFSKNVEYLKKLAQDHYVECINIYLEDYSRIKLILPISERNNLLE